MGAVPFLPVIAKGPYLKPAILVLTSTYPRWQQDTEPGFIQELCKRLAPDYTVHVVTSHYRGALPREEMDGVHVHRFRYAPDSLERLVYPGGMLTNVRLHPWTILLLPLFFCGQLFATWRLVRRHRIELVHAHWVIPQGLAVWLLRPVMRCVPLVVTSHGADVYGLRGGLFNALKRRVWSVADAVTVVSNAMAREVSGDLDENKLSVAPMGVDLRETFVPTAALDDRKDIIFVGRLVEKKGVDVLLQGFAGLLRDKQGLRLRIVGDGPWRESLVALTGSLGIEEAVEFLGAVPNGEVPGLLNRHAVSVVPSVVAASGDQEGLGLVSIEAMGCGCAVLASDLPAIRDVVQHERTGLLFKPGDAEDLREGLRRLLWNEDLRVALATAGREFALGSFDWSRAAGKYREIYSGLLEGVA